ncbi:MAG: NAD(P)/FAD-dependent oxidoreductase [Oscillospiraceae bacterium]|nr:NAD(P)/FAD-dependent oxidoreductase [Oscillospiraceae bacterium]
MTDKYDVAVIGGGPAGLAAAIAAERAGARVLLIEREARLGGILKQCVHDGFGLVRFGEKLAGPEYAERFLTQLRGTGVEVTPQTFVDEISPLKGPRADRVPPPTGFQLKLVSAKGMRNVRAKSVILATGCRERTARQVAIHGTRPAGIFTAGSAQYYTNILGQLPAKRCVILGSGDIGLIMARRLTLEGARVLGVYEAKPIPSGLPRNIAQCLHDFDIPLHLSKTVTRVFGHARLEAVEISDVDGVMRPIPGTQERVACDALILSVGLIPENELAEALGVALHPVTKGPVCDQNGMTSVPGVFSCGNAAHVNDLVDYVSESGETAGRAAAHYAMNNSQFTMNHYASLSVDDSFLYAMPQRIHLREPVDEITVFFRSREERGKTRFTARLGNEMILNKNYRQLRPPEMERLTVPLEGAELKPGDVIALEMEEMA